MMQKSMIATIQEKAGMPLDISSTHLKSYNNQWESINKTLTCQKKAMERNDKSNVNLTKLQFTRTSGGK